MSELQAFDWDELLVYVKDRRVVPIVGPGALLVDVDNKEVLLGSYVANRLAIRLKVQLESPNRTIAKVAFEYLKAGGRRQKVYAHIKAVLEERPLPLSATLQKLAAVTDLNLFVTTTFDGLLLRAVEDGRDQEVQSFSFSPTRPLQDLPPPGSEARQKPTVFHLFGEVSSLPDYAVTDEDTLEFLHDLLSESKRPHNLFDSLRENYLLVLGCNLRGWLARFFIRTVRNERLLSAADTGELIVDDVVRRDEDLVLFFRQYGTETYVAGGVASFVERFHDIWKTSQPAETKSRASSTAKGAEPLSAPSSAIFLCHAHEDRKVVRKLRSSLEEVGLESWMDERDIAPGSDWDAVIKNNIRRCALFIVCLSRTANARLEGYFLREWHFAIRRAEAIARTVRFIWPVVVDDLPDFDDLPPEDNNVPPEFGELQWARLEGGKPSDELLKELKKEIRRIRRARSQQIAK